MLRHRKKIVILIVVISALVMAFFVGTFFYMINHIDDDEYMIGRDTSDYFGDGRYQILRSINDYSFYDLRDVFAIEESVYRYKETEDYIYVVGKSGYSVVNYETGEVYKEDKIENLSTKDQKIFNNIFSFTVAGEDDKSYIELYANIFIIICTLIIYVIKRRRYYHFYITLS